MRTLYAASSLDGQRNKPSGLAQIAAVLHAVAGSGAERPLPEGGIIPPLLAFAAICTPVLLDPIQITPRCGMAKVGARRELDADLQGEKMAGTADFTGLRPSKDGATSADFTLGSLAVTTLARGTGSAFTVTSGPGAVDRPFDPRASRLKSGRSRTSCKTSAVSGRDAITPLSDDAARWSPCRFCKSLSLQRFRSIPSRAVSRLPVVEDQTNVARAGCVAGRARRSARRDYKPVRNSTETGMRKVAQHVPAVGPAGVPPTARMKGGTSPAPPPVSVALRAGCPQAPQPGRAVPPSAPSSFRIQFQSHPVPPEGRFSDREKINILLLRNAND